MTIGQLLIGKSTAYAAKRGGGTVTTINEINDLADGSVAIFGEHDNIINAAADFLDSKWFKIAVGGATTKKMRLSKRIYRRGASFSGYAYVAPVNERIFIGDDGSTTYDLNLPSTLVVGSVAEIRIEEFTETNRNLRKYQSFEYMVKTGDTDATIINALVALNNARTDRLVDMTAVSTSGANQSIKLDVIDNATKVKVFVGGILENAPVITKGKYAASNAVAFNPGVGTYAQILALEKKCLLNEGDENSQAWRTEMFSYAYQADADTTYEQFVMNWNVEKEYPTTKVNAVPQWLTLAYPTSGTALSTLRTLFIAAFNWATTAAPESGVQETNETIVS